MGPVWHWDYFVRKKGAAVFTFSWSVKCVLSGVVFILPFGAIGRLYSVIVALPGHSIYYFEPKIHVLRALTTKPPNTLGVIGRLYSVIL